MSSLTRVLPFVWPYRFKLGLSFCFALLVGIFWGTNLLMTFAVVKVILQDESLSEYSERRIEELEGKIAFHHADLKTQQEKLGLADADSAAPITKKLKKTHSLLADDSRSLTLHVWARDHIIRYVPSDQFDAFAAILGVLLVTTVLKGVCVFVQERLVGNVVQLTIMGLRKRSFRNALKLDYLSLASQGTAELTARFTYDMDVLTGGLHILGGKVIREPLKAAVCIICAFWINWRLALLSLLIAPLAALIFYRIGRRLKKASHRSIESMSRIYKVLGETFDAIKVVIAFDGGRRHRLRFHQENKSYYEKSMKIVTIDALTSPATELLGMLAIFLGLLPGAYLVLRSTTSIWGIKLATAPMEVAELSVLYSMIAGISDPARKLSSVYAKLKRASAAGDRVFAFLDRCPSVRQVAHPLPLPRHTKSIEFHDIQFSYGDSNAAQRPAVLTDFSLDVAAGEVIALVGANGSGKSTLVNLLPRFFDPQRGTVSIDGVDIREARLKDLRAQIGMVTQETLLFDETIYDNIRYGLPGTSAPAVHTAAEKAHVLDFVRQFPDGIHTCVGDKGSRLSGGQRQRVALARAILRDPAILILDEATSAIDAESEYLIHQVLKEFVKGRTTFIITHSVGHSILELVTRICIMEDGRLAGAGTHEELLRGCPAYQRLYNSQALQASAQMDDGDGRLSA